MLYVLTSLRDALPTKDADGALGQLSSGEQWSVFSTELPHTRCSTCNLN